MVSYFSRLHLLGRRNKYRTVFYSLVARDLTTVIRAEKRLKQLQKEFEREIQVNAEGVAAMMAFEDISWVAYHFGLPHPYPDHVSERPPRGMPPTPQSPRSPIGGRLGEKLRGLKLATSPTELGSSGGKSCLPSRCNRK